MPGEPGPRERARYAQIPDLAPDYCPGCRERRPMEQWIGQDYEMDPTEMVLCASCREKGPPPEESERLPTLTRNERALIRDMLTLGSQREVAKKNGLSEQTVGKIFQGKTRPHIRRAFQMLLESEGLDMFSLARLAKHLLGSTRAQWNKKEQDWDFFPDNMSRFNTFRHLTKIHEVEPMNEQEGASGTQVAVFIETNLGEGNPQKPGEYEVEEIER